MKRSNRLTRQLLPYINIYIAETAYFTHLPSSVEWHNFDGDGLMTDAVYKLFH